MEEHWSPTRLWLAKMTDAEVQETIDLACDEDWEALREEGVDLADLSLYSTVHRLHFALEEQESRKNMSGHEKMVRIAKLKDLTGDRAH